MNIAETALTIIEPTSPPTIAIDSPDRFINRELSWLLSTHVCWKRPTMSATRCSKRLRFLSISAANLDEFYMVRVAGLRGQIMAGVTAVSQDGRTPAQQLADVQREAGVLLDAQQRSWSRLLSELREAGIAVAAIDELSAADRKWLETRFIEHVFPVLTPLAIDPAHPFPFIPNLGLTIVLSLTRLEDGDAMKALIPLSPRIERFVRLPGEAVRYLLLEDMVGMFLDRLFPGYRVNGRGLFRVIRDSEMEIDEEAEDLVRVFESALKRRRRGQCFVSLSMPASGRSSGFHHLGNAGERERDFSAQWADRDG